LNSHKFSPLGFIPTLSQWCAIAMCIPILQGATQKEFVFEEAPFASCHASTVVELRNGELLAAWFGGTGEGKPDVAIWAARRSPTGWSEPEELAREPNTPAWNPVLFHAKTGRLWLYYKFGTNPREWSAGRRSSDDDGKTWSAAEHLPAGILGPIRAKPLLLGDGTIVSGSSVESYHSWAAWIERSADNGETWTKHGPITAAGSDEKAGTSGIIQPSVLQIAGAHLRFYARSTRDIGRICVSDSHDAGKTWSHARPTELPNPNSGIDAVRLPDGRIVIVYNNTQTGRTPLNLAVSRDGEHFKNFETLESEPGEYSYPAMIVGKDGTLHITYTWNRKRIRYAHVTNVD
jgi:predicted neuraminidase